MKIICLSTCRLVCVLKTQKRICLRRRKFFYDFEYDSNFFVLVVKRRKTEDLGTYLFHRHMSPVLSGLSLNDFLRHEFL